MVADLTIHTEHGTWTCGQPMCPMLGAMDGRAEPWADAKRRAQEHTRMTGHTVFISHHWTMGPTITTGTTDTTETET